MKLTTKVIGSVLASSLTGTSGWLVGEKVQLDRENTSLTQENADLKTDNENKAKKIEEQDKDIDQLGDALINKSVEFKAEIDALKMIINGQKHTNKTLTDGLLKSQRVKNRILYGCLVAQSYYPGIDCNED